MNSVFRTYAALLAFLFFLSACTNHSIDGPIQMHVIQPTGNGCEHKMQVATLHTLQSLSSFGGKVGQVVRFEGSYPQDKKSLIAYENMTPTSAHFIKSGDAYVPLGMDSLYVASLYYAIESGYLFFKNLDSVSDISKLAKDMSQTRILHDMNWTSKNSKGNTIGVTDNAAYFSSTQNGYVQDYFFSIATEDSQIPLGVNLGVIIHEYSHLVFEYLFDQKMNALEGDPDKGTNLINIFSLNEGQADYFAFVQTKNPKFLVCSSPSSAYRDLSQKKGETTSKNILQLLDKITAEDYINDSNNQIQHIGGALYASIQYQIGQKIGHERNAKILIKTLSGLASCLGGSNLKANFSEFMRCQKQSATSSEATTIQSIFQENFYGYTPGSGS